MKKLLALMLCAMLLLSGCSVMPGEGAVGTEIRDLVFTDRDGNTTDLTGLAVSVEAAMTDDAAGLRIALADDAGSEADIVAAVVGEENIVFTLQAGDESASYAVDVADLVEIVSEKLGGIITINTAPSASQDPEEEIPELTDEELEAIMAELEAAMAEMEANGDLYAEDEDTDTHADWEDQDAGADTYTDWEDDPQDHMARSEKASAVLEKCMTEGQTEIGGEPYATMDIHVAEEDALDLLNMVDFVAIGSLYFPLGDVLAAGGLSFTLDGSVAANEDGTKMIVALTPAVTTRQGDTYAIDLSMDSTAGDGSTVYSAAVTKNGTESLGSLSYVQTSIAAEDADWLPTRVDPDAVVLTDLSSEEAMQVLSDGLAAFSEQLSAMFGD